MRDKAMLDVLLLLRLPELQLPPQLQLLPELCSRVPLLLPLPPGDHPASVAMSTQLRF